MATEDDSEWLLRKPPPTGDDEATFDNYIFDLIKNIVLSYLITFLVNDNKDIISKK